VGERKKEAFYQIVDTSSLEEDPLQDTLSGNPITDVSQVLDPVVHLPTLQHLKVVTDEANLQTNLQKKNLRKKYRGSHF
jgi:hypothetical protein